MHKTYPSKPIRRLDVELRQKKIDIVIPFHGQYEKVYRLVKQIWVSVKSNVYEIQLIDDCSPNTGFITGFEKAPWTKTKRNTKQLGFGASLAEGFKNSKNELIVFMHSDCYIEDYRWLTELIRSYLILREQGVGLVSARSNNPGDDTEPALKSEKYQDTTDMIMDSGYVPLFCAICERSLFEKIQGFIKPYPYGYYEDEELAYRMRKFRLQQGISGKSWVGHEAGLTFQHLLRKNPGLSAVIEANRDQCIADLKSL